MDVLVVGVNFFYQPLEEEDVEHQHLGLMPPFGHGRREYLHFLLFRLYHHLVAHLMKKVDQSLVHIFIILRLDVSNQNILYSLPQ